MWISTQQVNYQSYILHSSKTGARMEMQGSGALAVYRLQESL
jgi:hypothetical protein